MEVSIDNVIAGALTLKKDEKSLRSVDTTNVLLFLLCAYSIIFF